MQRLRQQIKNDQRIDLQFVGNIYRFRKTLPSDLKKVFGESCPYQRSPKCFSELFQQDVSDFNKDVMHKFFHSATLGQYTRNGQVYPIHLRRTDGQKGCDTSPKAVLKYVECELRNAASEPHVLVVFSDERDPAYYEHLIQVLQDSNSNRKVVNGEELLRKTYPPESTYHNNYLLYSTVFSICKMKNSYVQRALLMDRQTCGVCTR